MSTPLCSACEFGRPDFGEHGEEWKHAYCAVPMKPPTASEFDYIKGAPTYQFCTIRRRFDSRCGPSGKEFQPREQGKTVVIVRRRWPWQQQ